MAYTTPVDVITGHLVTAAELNEQVFANIRGLHTGEMSLASQAALDFIFASSSGQLGRLAAGTALQVPRINAAGNGWEFATPAAVPTGANPSASVGLTVVNGAATTFLRSDGAPALDVSIAPTWTGAHVWKKAADSTTGWQIQDQDGNVIVNVDSVNNRVGIGTTTPGVRLVVQTTAGANVTSLAGSSIGLIQHGNEAGLRLESTCDGAGADQGATQNAGGILVGFFGTNDVRVAIVATSNIPITFRTTTGALDSATTERWRISPAGHLLPGLNNNYNLGEAGKVVQHAYLNAETVTVATYPIYLPNWSHSATGTAVVWNANGYLYQLTSSLAYKEHVSKTPWAVSPELLKKFVALSPRLWDYKEEESGAAGFISEDLEELGLLNAYGRSPLLNYDKDGRPHSNRDYALIGLQHLVLQDFEARLSKLEHVV